MNIFQKYSIRTRFNFITVSVIILILFMSVFFVFTFISMQKYNDYTQEIDQLKINYLNMRRFEQHFLLRHKEDENFFISGKNTYVKKLHSASKSISNIIKKLSANKITKDLDLFNILNEIETIHQKYISTFDELVIKSQKKGSPSAGVINKLIISGQKTYNLANSSSKNTISEMINYSNKYLYSGDEKYYISFLKDFKKLNSKNENPDSISDTNILNSKISNNFQKSLASFRNSFKTLVNLNKEIGTSYKEGLEGKLRNLKFKPLESFVKIVNNKRKEKHQNTKTLIFILFGAISILFLILFLRFSNSIVTPLNRLKIFIKPLSLGILPDEKLNYEGNDEVSEISKSVNNLIEGLKKTSSFAFSIGQGKYEKEYEPLSEKDTLGNSLIDMRKNLISANKEAEKRNQEDKIRTWTNEGLTKFNDILRQNQGNIKEMSEALISELVKFVNANQGGVFVFKNEENNNFLELTASYAYGHTKKKTKTILPGEGLVGTVAVEKETVYMTEIPETYITITSGLGGSVPRSLLITPMIVEDEVIGVIELASFNNLKNHEISFVETLSGNIASFLSITKINQKTAELFEQSQKQTELMKVQEEEMRKNFEELQQVQEESSRRSAEMSGILSAIDTSSLVIDINTDGKIISINRGLLELLGIPESELIDTNYKDFIHSENDEEYEKFWAKLVLGENIQRNEHIILNEKEFWFSVVYAPIIDSNDKILYILTMATDLTDAKKLENELKEREAQLRQNIEDINKSHKEAERKQYILENTNEMLKANEKTLHSAVETAMKQRKEIAKKIEEIAEEEALTSSRFEGINQTNVTFLLDLNGKIISANKIFLNLFGYSEKEIISKQQNILFSKQFLKSESYKKIWENLKSGIHVHDNFNFITKNKEKIFLQGTFTAIKARSGRTSNIFFIGFDTTELLMKSEELKARKTELFFQIQDMQLLQKESSEQQEKIIQKSFELAEKEAISKSRFDGINQTNLIAEFDTKGIITDVNEIFTTLFGYKKEELISKNHKIIISEDFAKSDKYKNLWKLLLQGKHTTGEFPFIGKNNKKIFVKGTFTAVSNTNNETIKIILMGYDNTELIMRTEELKARETELKFQIEELKDLQKELKNKLK